MDAEGSSTSISAYCSMISRYLRQALMGGTPTKQQPPESAGIPGNSLITESPAHSSGLSPSSTQESEKESLKDKDLQLLEQKEEKDEKEELELEKEFTTFDQNEINETKKLENEVTDTLSKSVSEEIPISTTDATVIAVTAVSASVTAAKAVAENKSECTKSQEERVSNIIVTNAEHTETCESIEKITTEIEHEEEIETGKISVEQHSEIKAEDKEEQLSSSTIIFEHVEKDLLQTNNEESALKVEDAIQKAIEQTVSEQNPIDETVSTSTKQVTENHQVVNSSDETFDEATKPKEALSNDAEVVTHTQFISEPTLEPVAGITSKEFLETKTEDAKNLASTNAEEKLDKQESQDFINNLDSSNKEILQNVLIIPTDESVNKSEINDVTSHEQILESTNECTEKPNIETAINTQESTVLSSDEQVTIEQSSDLSISDKSSLIDDIISPDTGKPDFLEEQDSNEIPPILVPHSPAAAGYEDAINKTSAESKTSSCKPEYDIITVDSLTEKSFQKVVNEDTSLTYSNTNLENVENDVIIVEAIIENTSNRDEKSDLVVDSNISYLPENKREDGIVQDESINSTIEQTSAEKNSNINTENKSLDLESEKAQDSSEISNFNDNIKMNEVYIQENSSLQHFTDSKADISLPSTESSTGNVLNESLENAVEIGTKSLEISLGVKENLSTEESTENKTTTNDDIHEETMILSDTALETDKEESTITVPDSLGDLELPSESTAEDVSEKLGFNNEKTLENSELEIKHGGEHLDVQSSDSTQDVTKSCTSSEISSVQLESKIPDIKDEPAKDVKDSENKNEYQLGLYIGGIPTINLIESDDIALTSSDEEIKISEDAKNIESDVSNFSEANETESKEILSQKANKDVSVPTEEIREEMTSITVLEKDISNSNETVEVSISHLEGSGRNLIEDDKVDENISQSVSKHDELKSTETNIIEEKELESSLQSKEQNVPDNVLDTAASTIQAAFRGYHTRQLLQGTECDENTPETETVQSEKVNSAPTNIDEQHDIAATKIQATFKGYQTRKALNKPEDQSQDEHVQDSTSEERTEELVDNEDLNLAATKIQATFKGYHTRKLLDNTDQEEKLESCDNQNNGIEKSENKDNIDLNSAATKIQATFKGYHTRKSLNKSGEELEAIEKRTKLVDKADEKAEFFNLTDAELNLAATKIQATYRGFQTRQAQQIQPSDTAAIPEEEINEASVRNSKESDITPVVQNMHTEGNGAPASSTEESKTESELVPSMQTLESNIILKESDEVSSSSMSSAATKIQAGVRGYLTRKHIHNTTNDTVASSFGTEPSISDSQPSVKETSLSIDDDGIRTPQSPETEIQKQGLFDNDLKEHVNGLQEEKNSEVDGNLEKLEDKKLSSAVTTKNVKLVNGNASEDLNNGDMNESSKLLHEKTLSTNYTESEEDKEVWKTIESELDDAATRIQSGYRSYRERQKLERKDAVQIPTSSSSAAESDIVTQKANELRTAGEFHDMVVLPSTDLTQISNESKSSE